MFPDSFLSLWRHPVSGRPIRYFRTAGVLGGFTEAGAGCMELEDFLQLDHFLSPRQVHSDIILTTDDFKRTGDRPAGDGVLVFAKNRVILIRTADCLPLFLWSRDGTCAGLLHVGRLGLVQGIEKKALALVLGAGRKIEEFNFFIGPGIEGRCYEVGPEAVDSFAGKSFAESIISPGKNDRSFLDLKKGLFLSLIEEAIDPGRIMDSGLCTFCLSDQFPSYRRQGELAGRIMNFLLLL